MKKEVSQALSNANYRITLENQKEKIKEVFHSDLLYSFNGGFFKLGPILFFEVKMHLDDGNQEFIIPDIYENLIEIEDGEKFYKAARSKYQEAINRYQMSLNKLIYQRNTKDLVQVHWADDIEE